MSTVKAVTARLAHFCSDCQWRGQQEVPVIAPGHRYLRHVGFPGEDGVSGDRPWVVRECIACAGERDDTDPLLVADACGTFCHGTTPCALPFEKGSPDHEHACRECVLERARGGVR